MTVEFENCRNCRTPLKQRFCSKCGLDSQCDSCGGVLTSAFCGHCGAPAAGPMGDADIANSEGVKGRGRKWIVIGAVAILLLILGSVAVAIASRDEKSVTSESSKSQTSTSTSSVVVTTTQATPQTTVPPLPASRTLTVEFNANIRFYQQNYLSDVCGDSAPMSVSIRNATGVVVAAGLANSIPGSSNCGYVGRFSNVPESAFYVVGFGTREITVPSSSITNNVIRLVQSSVGGWAPA